MGESLPGKGEVTLRFDVDESEIHLAQAASRVKACISDVTGFDMDDDDIPFVFDYVAPRESGSGRAFDVVVKDPNLFPELNVLVLDVNVKVQGVQARIVVDGIDGEDTEEIVSPDETVGNVDFHDGDLDAEGFRFDSKRAAEDTAELFRTLEIGVTVNEESTVGALFNRQAAKPDVGIEDGVEDTREYPDSED
jgi:hypothetical protein